MSEGSHYQPKADAAPDCSYKSRGGLRRVFNAARYSSRGLCAGWRHEAAFRQEVVLGVPMLASLPWTAPSLTFAVLMAGAVLLVWAVEMINSAVEALADAISVDFHPLLGRAKDLGSAAVMCSLVLAAVVWGAGLYIRMSL